MGTNQSHTVENDNYENDELWWRSSSDKPNKTSMDNNEDENVERKYLEETDIEKQSTNTIDDEKNNSNKETKDNAGNVLNVDGYSRSLDSREKLELFKKHLETKRAERQTIIMEKRREMEQLRADLATEKQTNQLLREKIVSLTTNRRSSNGETTERVVSSESKIDLLEVDALLQENILLKSQVKELHEELQKIDEISRKNRELQNEQAALQRELQSLNTQIIDYEQQKNEFQKHIAALKDVIKISKQMILLREGELQELKQKITYIENLLSDHEMNAMSNDLRKEYERQLRNIRNLRSLYEERARISRIELQNVRDQLSDTQQKLDYETNKNGELQQRIDELEENVSKKYDEVCSLESNLGLSKAECRGLKHEMAVINQLFAQFLLGFNTPTQDLDKLVKILEENHDLLMDINTKNNSNEETSPAFPRLILNLINQIGDRKQSDSSDKKSNNEEIITDTEKNEIEVTNDTLPNQSINVDEIVTNLPKVWRVLIELLSHQTVQPVEINLPSNSNPVPQDTAASNPCYKSVETPAGTRYELSVSKTYIRLKDLILEKKYLEKEMLKMKSLNTHLEERLRNQETRLVVVTKELNKTWHIVGRLQRQHEQLHTHEKILRYELSQKRKMLNELKEELEYCKETWERAREKNAKSEHECHKLRSEFAARRCKTILEDPNNSTESGYSDEQEDDDDSDDDLLEILPSNRNIPNISTNNETCHSEHSVSYSSNADVNSILNSTFEKSDSDGPEVVSQDEVTVSDELIPIAPDCNVVNIVTNFTENIPCPDSTKNVILKLENESNVDSIENVEAQNCDQVHSLNKEYNNFRAENVNLPSTSFKIQNDKTISDCDKSIKEIDISMTSNNEDLIKLREERFKRLEEHCQNLKKTYISQTERGTVLCKKLDTIHKQFGGTDSLPKPSTSSSSNSAYLSVIEETDEQDLEKSDKLEDLEGENRLRIGHENNETNFKDVCLPHIKDSGGESSDKVKKDTLEDLKTEESLQNLEEQCKYENNKITENCSTNNIDKLSEFDVNTIKTGDIKSSESPQSEVNPDLKREMEKEERFKRLENYCKQLKEKYSNQNSRGTEICSQLDSLHQRYSQSGSKIDSKEEKQIEDVELHKTVQESRSDDCLPTCSEDNSLIGSEEKQDVELSEKLVSERNSIVDVESREN